MYSIIEVQDQTGDPARDLCTVQDVLAEIGGEDDGTIQDQISLYSKIISSWCDREFVKEYLTETFVLGWGECPSFLPLSRYPVDVVYSVEIDGAEISSTNYEADPVTGLLHYICGKWYGRRIAVTYVGGYDLPDDAPAPLSRACVEFVKDQRLNAGRDPTIREIEDDGSRVSYWVGTRTDANQAFPIGVINLISPFRRLSV